MALQFPTFPDPRDRNNPVADAYAYTSNLTIDVRNDAVTVTMHVHPNEAAWQDTPVGSITFEGGEDNGDGTSFPRPSELMSDPIFAQAYNYIGQVIYGHAKLSPKCATATDFPPAS
jgi:hypothetical protein